MSAMKAEMNPVSLTAFFPCGVRAEDARATRPLVGDQFAERFMNERGRALSQEMKQFHLASMSTLERHHIIDERVRTELARFPQLRIIIIGAGFDSRAFRLRGGQWIEIDERAIIDYKEERLPAREAPNPLQRVAIDFSSEKLVDRLAPFADAERALVIIEGVLLYLDRAQMEATAAAAASVAPHVTVLCDAMTPTFLARRGHDVHDHLAKLGAPFRQQFVPLLDVWQSHGFRTVARWSIIDALRERGHLRVPRWILRHVMRWMYDGYVVYEFARR
jgi:methyltransferase (TIGR00027 family)